MRLEPCDGTALTVSANAIVQPAACIVQGVVITPAAAASTISLYDPAALPYLLTAGVATTVGATLRVTLNAVANGASVVLPLSGSGIRFQNGCIAVITGSAAVGFVQSAITY